MMHGRTTNRRLALTLLALAPITELSGCLSSRHKMAPPTGLPVIVALLEPPLPTVDPSMNDTTPPAVFAPSPIKVTEARPRRIRRSQKPASAEEKATPADEAEASGSQLDAADIGELSSGGGSHSQNRQEATGLIATSDKRLATLPPLILSQQLSQIRRVRNFLRQARQALSSGDAEGAKNLATKAKLLLDDLTK